jgi:dolichyl-diphosphooligosaccharide--protein glycosyltransferase
MTVPYATDNSVGVEQGGTDSSVVALEDYRLQAGPPFSPTAIGSTQVAEDAIYDGRTIQVTLEAVTEYGDVLVTDGSEEPRTQDEDADLEAVPERPAPPEPTGPAVPVLD